MERQYDLVIIGAGPAGLSAALYGSRAGLKTLILESGAPGGKLIKTNKISNYPGVKTMEGTQLRRRARTAAACSGSPRCDRHRS